jgi:glucokinase
MFLGIEIGGTKLQLGVGPGDGTLAGLRRETVEVAAGPDGIRRQITAAVPELLAKLRIERSQIRGVGIGFGGPVDDATRTIIRSHQIEGWDHFPLAAWITDMLGWPAVLGNDADVAGLAEALFGAGKGLSPVFYVTIGSGIGGGLIIGGEIYRGGGRGAAEIGHLSFSDLSDKPPEFRANVLEARASGWAIERMARDFVCDKDHPHGRPNALMLRLAGGRLEDITAYHVRLAAEQGDADAQTILSRAIDGLTVAVCHVIALLCPRRIVIGGGIALIGERLLFGPLRLRIARYVFQPFAGVTEIAPAALGEEVVVHGALALARRRLGGSDQ